MSCQFLQLRRAAFIILLQGASALPLLGQQIAAEHPSQYVPFLQSSEYLKKVGYENAEVQFQQFDLFKDLHEELHGADANEVSEEEHDADQFCEYNLPSCPGVVDAALYNTRLVDVLQTCQNDIARICPKELKARTQRLEKLQQSLLAFGPADTQFDAVKASFDTMPEHCTSRSKACQSREFLAILNNKEHSRRTEMPNVKYHARKLQWCKKKSLHVVQMAVEATARHSLTSLRKAFRGVLEWLRFTDRISANEFDGAWASVNQFLTKGSFEKKARDELYVVSEPSPPGGKFPERREKKVAEVTCPDTIKHQQYVLGKYVNEKVHAFGSSQVLDATFGACIWLSNTGKCLQLIAAMSAGKRMDECHMTADSGAGHTLLDSMLPHALQSMQNMEVDVSDILEGAFRSIHGGRSSYVNEDHGKVLAFWRSQVDRDVPSAVDQHNAIMMALEAAAKQAVQAAAQVPCASYVNKDL